MAIPKTLRNFTAFVDGRGYAGRIEEIELPKLTLKTEEWRGGGMDAPIEIDLGMEKIETTLTFAEYDRELFKLFGLADGNRVGLTLRGAVQADSASEAVIVTLRGLVKELDAGTWKAGDQASLKMMVAARYYKLEIGGQTIIEIDTENMIRRIGGSDQLASQRQALGV
ncbi:MAG: phage major tail tube protein [Pseudomonadota bacterium]